MFPSSIAALPTEEKRNYMQKETKMESLHSIQDVMQSTDHRTMLKQTRASIFF